MNREEVLKLSELARISISNEEAAKLSHEFEAILSYVGEIKKAKLKEVKPEKGDYLFVNNMREDGEPHETGKYTETLLKEVPNRHDNYVRVKKIL